MKSPYSYGRKSTVKTMYENLKLQELLKKLWTKNNWDWKIVASNYEYTANRTIEEILPEKNANDLQEFLREVWNVKKV